MKSISSKQYFFIVSIILLFFLGTLSQNYGISGDERFHSVYGKICYDFYKTMGKDSTALSFDFGDGGKVIYYGPSVDLFTEFIYDLFEINRDKYMFEVKHLLDSVVLWLLIFSGSCIVVFFTQNWWWGIFSIIMFLAYPRLLADGMNNPKDAVFAGFYISSIYFIFRIIKSMPSPKWSHIIGLIFSFGLAMGNRVGGFILIFYFGLFMAGYVLLNKELIPQIKANFKNIFIKFSVLLFFGYSLGVIFWPYALVSPIQHVIDALNYFTNQPYQLKTLFNGAKIFSTELPSIYIFKWLFITATEVVLLGVLLLLFKFIRIKEFKENYLLFCLFFTFIFPAAYIIYKSSGLYNGIRHLAFIIPSLIVCGVLGIYYMYERIKNTKIKLVFVSFIGVLLFLPIYFSFTNHSFELVYFNKLSGGVKAAYGKYDTDYFGVTLREAAEWLIENEKISKNTVIGINYPTLPVDYYFRKKIDSFSTRYFRYNERDNTNFDYYIINTALLSPDIIQNGLFPPKGTIKTIDVEGVPMTAIVKKEDNNDYYGKKALDSGQLAKAIEFLNKAILYDNKNEITWSNLGMAQLQLGQSAASIVSFRKSLELSPENLQALNGLAYAYLNTNEINYAKMTLETMIEKNPNFAPAYDLLSKIYANQGNSQMAQQYNNYYKQLTGN